MNKTLLAAVAAAGALAAAATIFLRRRTVAPSSAPIAASPVIVEPIDELVAAARAVLAASDKIDPDSAIVSRTASGGLVLYGQVSSSAAAGMLARRVRAIDPQVEVVSQFKVAKRG